MAENTGEVLLGGAVLAVAAGFLLYLGQATGGGILPRSGSYELTASFRSVQGVSVGSDVRLAGVKVGTITALDLNPQTFRADARVAVDEDIVLPDDSAILISSEGLLGGNYVEIVPGGSPLNMAPGDEFLDTQGAVSLMTLLMRFVGGGGDTAPPDAGTDAGAATDAP
ncbi:MAG: outer membrane lipid asymmetry maintenance protein MlaD, partial [Rhodobacteraceae bacterium]|nr:outer membrane lipid asymmetry maintenance protein MlaD [Paracoccaceae bacterium]